VRPEEERLKAEAGVMGRDGVFLVGPPASVAVTFRANSPALMNRMLRDEPRQFSACVENDNAVAYRTKINRQMPMTQLGLFDDETLL
jgi:hypothetical protein